ncbi:hypothetical protein PBY51_002228 [Eleginops maclovinus]|uniref:Transmembrane protein 238 n=1 Tax=Eleginops maclovinus TaxID=56733 RepID=A0AAN7X1D2_ELEMC|nr:hypothetical protein PBY51_002228 [Eleginops maclovinus]
MAPSCVGNCAPLFYLAVVFDAAGLVVLLVGIFGNLKVDGRFYGDFLIFTGSIVIFLSLMWWVPWYAGNVDQCTEDRAGSLEINFTQWARKLSERLSKGGMKPLEAGDEKKKKSVGDVEEMNRTVRAAPCRVTWEVGSRPSGAMPGQDNTGFDGWPECAGPADRNVELGVLKNCSGAPAAGGKAERLL